MEKQAVKEQLSALLDGELDRERIEAVLHEAKQEVALVETADVYVQIRDVLQGREPYRQPSIHLLPSIMERLEIKSYLSVDLGEPDSEDARKLFVVDV